MAPSVWHTDLTENLSSEVAWICCTFLEGLDQKGSGWEITQPRARRLMSSEHSGLQLCPDSSLILLGRSSVGRDSRVRPPTARRKIKFSFRRWFRRSLRSFARLSELVGNVCSAIMTSSWIEWKQGFSSDFVCLSIWDQDMIILCIAKVGRLFNLCKSTRVLFCTK